MRSGTMGARQRSGLAGAAVLAVCWAAAAAAAPQTDSPTEAVWTAKELRFAYQGFTTKYSCDGLRDKMRRILLKLGARADMQLQSSCTNLTGPDPFAGVNIKVNVLQPVEPGAAGTSGAVAAHWKTVDLVLHQDPVQASGDCELVEQVKLRVLPLFTTRNVEYSSSCVPHQLNVGDIRLRAEVLVSDKSPATAVAHSE